MSIIDDDMVNELIQERCEDFSNSSTEEMREAFDSMNQSITDNWELYLDAVNDGAHTIVHEDDDVIVLADHQGRFWREHAEIVLGIDYPDCSPSEHDLCSVIYSVQHVLAEKVSDHSWSQDVPAVVLK